MKAHMIVGTPMLFAAIVFAWRNEQVLLWLLGAVIVIGEVWIYKAARSMNKPQNPKGQFPNL